MRQLRGKVETVPIVTSIPDDTVTGADLSFFADGTAVYSNVRPRTLGLFLQLSGGTSIQFQVFVRVLIPNQADLGWAQCYDTNNPGVLGGTLQPIPSPGTYIFLVNYAAIYSQLVLYAYNNVGGVVVEDAQLIEYAEYITER
jgi:hypothetical protein